MADSNVSALSSTSSCSTLGSPVRDGSSRLRVSVLTSRVAGLDTSKVGVEMTEVLERATGRARAGDADLAGRIRETIAGLLANVGARGAAVDGHVDGLPHRRSDADGLAENLREHLRHHGEALARDHWVVDVSFHFPWVVISRITRLDHLGGVVLLDDRHSVACPATTGRTAAEIEAALEAAVLRKVALASGYERSRPLWLVLRNPYLPPGVCVR